MKDTSYRNDYNIIKEYRTNLEIYNGKCELR